VLCSLGRWCQGSCFRGGGKGGGRGIILEFGTKIWKLSTPMNVSQCRCFNDDIQGTGCVTLSGLMSAARNSGSKITDMRIMCVGAGSAGLGVCSLLMAGMVEAGLSEEEVRNKCLYFCTFL
jgi:malic enzyme